MLPVAATSTPLLAILLFNRTRQSPETIAYFQQTADVTDPKSIYRTRVRRNGSLIDIRISGSKKWYKIKKATALIKRWLEMIGEEIISG